MCLIVSNVYIIVIIIIRSEKQSGLNSCLNHKQWPSGGRSGTTAVSESVGVRKETQSTPRISAAIRRPLACTVTTCSQLPQTSPAHLSPCYGRSVPRSPHSLPTPHYFIRLHSSLRPRHNPSRASHVLLVYDPLWELVTVYKVLHATQAVKSFMKSYQVCLRDRTPCVSTSLLGCRTYFFSLPLFLQELKSLCSRHRAGFI